MSDEPKALPYTEVDSWHPTEEEARLIASAVANAIRDHIADLGAELTAPPLLLTDSRP